MHIIKNILIAGSEGRPMATDIFFEEDARKKPVVVYAHGFNGFKDWANFDLIAKSFAAAGFAFVKFNFSHNGTTPEDPEDFGDLHAFGLNNYSKEIADIRFITDWICDAANPYSPALDAQEIYLIGHSLGGGISILSAFEDARIRKLITWASICVCKTPWGSWPTEKMQEWKQDGVKYYENGRTKQQMPLYYQLYEDFVQHESRLDIRNAITNLQIPVLVCHGTEDSAVDVQAAYLLKEWQPAARLFTLASDHVFGRRHPWPHEYLPEPMEAVLKETIDFMVAES